MRQRLLDGCGRRDMVPGSAAARTELRDYCSGKGVINIVAQVCMQISSGANPIAHLHCVKQLKQPEASSPKSMALQLERRCRYLSFLHVSRRAYKP